jgi:hypothetical protein
VLLKVKALVCSLAALGALTLTTSAAAAASTTPAPAPAQSNAVTVPISGSGTNPSGQAVNFAGTFTPQHFQTQNGQLTVTGALVGTLTNTVTGATQPVAAQQVTMPVASANATCPILNLTVGPLDLNLLGLMVHLNQVVLTINAQSGPGNLLGNLLCSVAGLLDNGGSTTALAQLLNQILAAL